MKILKERKSLLVKILVSVLLVFMCYSLSVKTFHWAVCGERDRSDVELALFLEVCPKEAEQWYEKKLYWEECAKNDKELPPHTELLISACTNPNVRGVPGGETLFVHEAKTGEIYLLDLRTGEKKQVPDALLLLNKGIFLSSELVWLEGSSTEPGTNGYRPHYILDLTNGQRYELLDLNWTPLKNGEFDVQNYEYIKSAEQVFIYHTYNRLIALASNSRQQPEKNVIFHANGELLKRLMKDLRVNYEVIDFSLDYAEVPSPTGKYVVRPDGIYLAGTDTLIIARDYTGGINMTAFKGWYYDESGVVFSQGSYYYFQMNPFGSRLRLPRPILKLNLPSQ